MKKFRDIKRYKNIYGANFVFLFSSSLAWSHSRRRHFFCSFVHLYKEILNRYRKIPYLSPWLMNIRKYILGGLYLRRAYIQRPFCVSICKRKHLKSIIISIQYPYDWKNDLSLSQSQLYFPLKSM